MKFQFKRPDTFTLIIIGGVVSILVIFAYLGSSLSRLGIVKLPMFTNPFAGSKISSVSSDILYLTSPVTTINDAKITQISGNTLQVESRGAISLPTSQAEIIAATQKSTTTPIPTPIFKILRFQIEVADNATIRRSILSIPYNFSKTNPTLSNQEGLKVSDLKVGDVLSISTDSDLRLKNDKVTAFYLTIQPKQNNITGTVTSIQGNTLKVQGAPTSLVDGQLQSPKEYTANLSSSTEITLQKVGLAPSQAKREDIAVGQAVTVYSNSDVTQISTMDVQKLDIIQGPVNSFPPVPSLEVSNP